jgi:hypothetical protein
MVWRRWLLGIALLAYLAFVSKNNAFVVGGADSSGYFNFARMLVNGQLRIDVEPIEELKLDASWVPVFAPSGFKPAPRGRAIVPTYPAGFPLHLAAFIQIGWDAAHRVTTFAATICLLLMVLVARQLGLAEWQAWAGAAILGAFPTFILVATQPLSDVVATMWALAAVWFALKERPTLAGVAFAIGVLVRPTNLLLAPALIVAMKPRQLVIAALAALPLGIGLLVLQNVLYGSPWQTGYGGGMLALEHFRGAAWAHALGLGTLLTPLVFPLGLVTKRVLLLAWFIPFFAFYAFYGVYDSWGTTRFLLPAVPALIFGALLLLERVPKLIAAILVFAMIAVPIKHTRELHVLDVPRREHIYSDSVFWANRQIPGDAMVIAGLFTGTFFFYEGRWTVNWPMLDGDRFQLLRAYAGPRKWYALLSDVELPREELRRRYPGRWVAVGRREDVTLWRLDDD